MLRGARRGLAEARAFKFRKPACRQTLQRETAARDARRCTVMRKSKDEHDGQGRLEAQSSGMERRCGGLSLREQLEPVRSCPDCHGDDDGHRPPAEHIVSDCRSPFRKDKAGFAAMRDKADYGVQP